jgi:aspartyl-tRNA(Asn)/glutamyl-tRNA(Gln) amidotransferase subunit C
MLSRKEVEHIAHLAHLQLRPEEVEKMQQQLSAILDYMQILREIDTPAIPPTAQVLPLENIARTDEVAPPLHHEETMANAPEKEAGLFRVPPVLE